MSWTWHAFPALWIEPREYSIDYSQKLSKLALKVTNCPLYPLLVGLQ
jgi:hypothetical protein